MRRTHLALIPALWLALAGMAPPQSFTPTAVLECRAPRETAADRYGTLLPVARSKDSSVPPDLDLMHAYEVSGLSVFGLPVLVSGVSYIRKPGMDSLMFMAVTAKPYEQMRAAALKGHGLSTCVAEESDRCVVLRVEADGWRKLAVVQRRDDKASFSCTYQRIF